MTRGVRNLMVTARVIFAAICGVTHARACEVLSKRRRALVDFAVPFVALFVLNLL